MRWPKWKKENAPAAEWKQAAAVHVYVLRELVHNAVYVGLQNGVRLDGTQKMGDIAELVRKLGGQMFEIGGDLEKYLIEKKPASLEDVDQLAQAWLDVHFTPLLGIERPKPEDMN